MFKALGPTLLGPVEVEIPGADHFHIVNAESEAWRQAIVPALAAWDLLKRWVWIKQWGIYWGYHGDSITTW